MRDFFVSYTRKDKMWAEWIAWVLEDAGYTTYIQAWDFTPGHNFVLDMDRATRESQKTILVLSDAYLKSVYTNPEWAARFSQDPMGNLSKIIPIRIEKVSTIGLLKQIVSIDFFDTADKEELKKRLLEGVTDRRAKPTSEPSLKLYDGSTSARIHLIRCLVNNDIIITREKLNLPCIYQLQDNYYTNLTVRYDKLVANEHCVCALCDYISQSCSVLNGASVVSPQSIGSSHVYENALIQVIAQKTNAQIDPINYNRRQICVIGTLNAEYINRISKTIDYVKKIIAIFGPSYGVLVTQWGRNAEKIQCVISPDDIGLLDGDERWYII